MRVFTAAILVVYFTYGLAASTENPNTTTTVKTTTTTVTTTTVAPPVPVPSNSTYDVKNGSQICLMLQTDLVLRIPYFNKKGESLLKEFFLNSTNNKEVYVTGICTLEYEYVSLTWAPTAKADEQLSTTLNFTLLAKDEVFSLSSIVFQYKMSDALFPGTNDTRSYLVSNEKSLFICPLNYYYQCKAAESFALTPSAGKPPLVTYELSNLKVEAFRNAPNKTFIGKLRECTADSVTDRVVPIIVGVALAVMIIVAIVTFIIGSRRRRVGYQSI